MKLNYINDKQGALSKDGSCVNKKKKQYERYWQNSNLFSIYQQTVQKKESLVVQLGL